MNLPEASDVSPAKLAELLTRMAALRIDPAAIDEQFVRGGGPGGQKINKTSNCVVLRYPPLALIVRCQQDRRRSVNRFLALRELVDQVEMKIAPERSRRLQDIDRKRKKKARAGRRARAKHRDATPPEEPPL
ncbi:MAG TPA: peptide chain release factor-like protein [Planctomycetota bacterium]|nr:peptide chain release factor-like protein [Planctomycetota bacterium]